MEQLADLNVLNVLSSDETGVTPARHAATGTSRRTSNNILASHRRNTGRPRSHAWADGGRRLDATSPDAENPAGAAILRVGDLMGRMAHGIDCERTIVQSALRSGPTCGEVKLHPQRPILNYSLRRLRLAAGITENQVAEEIMRLVAIQAGRDHAIDGNYISKLERGVITWPNRAYRQAFRTLFGVSSDAELGFYSTRTRREAELWLSLPDSAPHRQQGPALPGIPGFGTGIDDRLTVETQQ